MSRILIAEEEPRISSFMERGVRQSGYATLVAASGSEALRLATSGEFDLLILDLGLPAMDGIEVIEALHRREVRIPVVVVTGRAGVREALADFDGGAVAYFAKPFRFDDLLECVRTFLSATIAPEAV